MAMNIGSCEVLRPVADGDAADAAVGREHLWLVSTAMMSLYLVTDQYGPEHALVVQ